MNRSKIIILSLLFILSVFLVLWIDFDIFPLIPINKSNPKKINAIIETLSLSYITSFIFYIVVVLHKEIYDIKNSTPNIQRKLQLIKNRSIHFKSKLEKIDAIPFADEIPTKEELDKKLNTINVTSDAGEKRLYPFSWEQMFKEHTNETRNTIDRILILLPYLDTKLIHTLNILYDCSFFNMAVGLAPVELINSKLREIGGKNAPSFALAYSSVIVEYFKVCRELNKFIILTTCP